MRKREKPMIVCRKEPRGLVPVTGFDAEQLDALPLHSTVKVEPGSERGHDQLAAYWATLSRVAEATGRWPSREHLHDAIKFDLGYVTVTRTMRGEPRLIVDSIALASMSDAERGKFIQAAFALIAETTGIDPADLRREAREAA